MPFWSRRVPEEPPSWEELFPLEAMLRSQLDDVLIVAGAAAARPLRRVRGPPSGVDPRRPSSACGPAWRPHGYTPFLREDQGTVVGARGGPGGGGRAVPAAPPSRALPRDRRSRRSSQVPCRLAGCHRASCGSIRAGSSWACRSRCLSSGSWACTSSGTTRLVASTACPSPSRISSRCLRRSFWARSARSSGFAARFAIAGRCSTWRWPGRLPASSSRCPVYVLGLKLSTVVQIPQVAEGGYVQFGDALLPKLLERLDPRRPAARLRHPAPSRRRRRLVRLLRHRAEPHPGGPARRGPHRLRAVRPAACAHLQARRGRAGRDRASSSAASTGCSGRPSSSASWGSATPRPWTTSRRSTAGAVPSGCSRCFCLALLLPPVPLSVH